MLVLRAHSSLSYSADVLICVVSYVLSFFSHRQGTDVRVSLRISGARAHSLCDLHSLITTTMHMFMYLWTYVRIAGRVPHIQTFQLTHATVDRKYIAARAQGPPKNIMAASDVSLSIPAVCLSFLPRVSHFWLNSIGLKILHDSKLDSYPEYYKSHLEPPSKSIFFK
jgi:hypothetical protein